MYLYLTYISEKTKPSYSSYYESLILTNTTENLELIQNIFMPKYHHLGDKINSSRYEYDTDNRPLLTNTVSGLFKTPSIQMNFGEEKIILENDEQDKANNGEVDNEQDFQEKGNFSAEELSVTEEFVQNWSQINLTLGFYEIKFNSVLNHDLKVTSISFHFVDLP